MNESLSHARQTFILGLSRISQFWGFPKAMGAIYAALYLSPTVLSLDDLVEQVEVTKGAVSTNVRSLERLGMVHKQIQIGERRDFYTAETDFWKIIKGILREREKSEFDRALQSVEDSLKILNTAELNTDDLQIAAFYTQRLQSIQSFFHSLDNLVATIIALDELRAGTIERILGLRKKDPQER